MHHIQSLTNPHVHAIDRMHRKISPLQMPIHDLSFGVRTRERIFCTFSFTLAFIMLTGTCVAQLSRSQKARNTYRTMTYQGHLKNNLSRSDRFYFFEAGLSSLNYYGDLAPTPKRISTDMALSRPGFSIAYGRRITSFVSLRAGFMFGTLAGSDSKSADKNDLSNGIFRARRNLSFRNRIKELSLSAVIYLHDHYHYFSERPLISPYLTIGVGVIHHNPQARIPDVDLNGNALPGAGQWTNLRQYGTEGQYSHLSPGDVNYGNKPYNLIQPVIPMGVGVRVRLTERLDFNAELAMRYLFTDYIDDVSRNYVDLGSLNSDVARALSYRTNEVETPNTTYLSEANGQTYHVLAGYGQEYRDNKRGNSSNKDIYSVFSFRLLCILGHQTRAPRYIR